MQGKSSISKKLTIKGSDLQAFLDAFVSPDGDLWHDDYAEKFWDDNGKMLIDSETVYTLDESLGFIYDAQDNSFRESLADVYLSWLTQQHYDEYYVRVPKGEGRNAEAILTAAGYDFDKL